MAGYECNSRKLIRMLESEGWFRVSVKGDHYQFKHKEKTGRITVSHPKKNLPLGTVYSIYKQAGWR